MRVSEAVRCIDFPCSDLVQERYSVPAYKVDPNSVGLLMITEAPALNPDDDLSSPGMPFYLQTTVAAFADAGQTVASMQDILALGVYITSAIKCAKSGYAVKAAPIKECSSLLEREIALFPKVKGILLMGDVAIQAFNAIARRRTGRRAIPAGSTYKIRDQAYSLDDVRLFPSYLQTGKSYLIEGSKRRMIAEDLRAALALLG